MKKNIMLKAMPLVLAVMLGATGCGAKYDAAQSADTGFIKKSINGKISSIFDTDCEIAADNGGAMFYDAGIMMNTEEYSEWTEAGFLNAADTPLSTFSADVDTASYSNIRRYITDEYPIPKDIVRIEEMINYFKYDYPDPNEGEPFSVTTELTDCPWNTEHKLMMIGMQAKHIDLSERKPMNLVFLIDVSGSMYSADKLPLVQKAFGMLTDELTKQDTVSIVTYAGADSVVLEGVSGNETVRIREAVEGLEAGGSTAGAAGIKTAYEIAQKYKIQGGNNRVILATDGDLNVGISSEEGLKALIEEEREKGIFLSVLGFGTGNIKDNKMETLADNGNGNYAYIDSENEARRVLVEEMGGTLETVAKDVKFQVEFNPDYVSEYRLIGYENRMLNAEDFDDDTKDAGEIGAGHTVTALYEIAAQDAPAAENVCTVAVRYKAPNGNKSQLLNYPVSAAIYTPECSADMRFASAVAAFGLVLRDSEFKGDASRSLVNDLLSDETILNDPYKAEFAELVNQAKFDN